MPGKSGAGSSLPRAPDFPLARRRAMRFSRSSSSTLRARREVRVALGVVFHGEAVAGEGVGGVGGEDFGEGGDLVHDLMVRCCGCGWQVGEQTTADLWEDADSGTDNCVQDCVRRFAGVTSS